MSLLKMMKKEKDFIYYIASPLNSSTADGIYKNMLKAKQYMKEVDLAVERENAAVCLHFFLPKYFSDHVKKNRRYALRSGRGLIKLCDALVVCTERISAGMWKEIKFAYHHKKNLYLLDEFHGKHGIPTLFPVTYEFLKQRYKRQ